jgi:hypothetical protein
VIIWEGAKVAKGGIIRLVVRARRIVRTRFTLRGVVEHAGREERKGVPTTADRPPMESSVLRPSCTFELMSSKS